MIDPHLLTVIERLGAATLLGGAIGLEREWRGHDAGLRTHGLVALSSAMLTLSAIMMAGNDGDPVRVVQGLAQAIGFIAGGLIFVRGGDVRNMTTAASLWMACAIGITAGAGQFTLMIVGAAMAIMLLSMLYIARWLMPHRRKDSGETSTSNRRGSPPSE